MLTGMRPFRGILVTDGWGGRQEQPVIVEGETPKRYRVRAVNAELRLPRGGGVLKVLRSGTVLVPKYAVRASSPSEFAAGITEGIAPVSVAKNDQ
jgi:hypothetical protein